MNDPNLIQQFHTRNKRLGALMIVLAMIVAVGGVIYNAMNPPLPQTQKMGVHLLLDDGRVSWPVKLWSEHIDYAAKVGRYVVQLVRSDDLDTEKWQTFMDLCADRGLIPIIRLATTWNDAQNAWDAPPRDADETYTTIARDYADFLAALRWPDETPRYVIVGNEPNHGEEWGGVPDPAAYARFLLDVSAAVKETVPTAQIASAPLDPYTPHTNGQPFENGMVYIDAESFMDAMTQAEPKIWDSVDVWASHSYPIDQSAPPWERVHKIDYLNGAGNPDVTPPVGGVFNRGINSYRWELFKLGSLGVTRVLPVLVTETGWRADRVADAETLARYYDLSLQGNYGRYPDSPESGWTPWLRDDLVVAVVPFALDGNPAEWDAHNWLDVDADGTITGTRPIFDLAAALFAVPEAQSARN